MASPGHLAPLALALPPPAAARRQLVGTSCKAPCSQQPPLVACLIPPGENKIKDDYNAVHVADTPCVDALRAVPGRFRTIKAHGTAVGLPSDDDMGNSEVGACCRG